MASRPKLVDDCFVQGVDRISHGAAIEALRSRLSPVADVAWVDLRDLDGRVIAEPIPAARAIPAHTNAAVDGFAFHHADYDAAAGTAFPVSGRAAAGHPLQSVPPSGAAVRIFTGAAMPAGLDTVAMQEDVRGGEDPNHGPVAHVPGGLKRGANVRQAGEDVAMGAALFQTGDMLRPQDLAALAAQGLSGANCFERLDAAIVSTGDEIIRADGAGFRDGAVFDTNAPMLAALVERAGARAHDLGIWPDDFERVRAGLAEAARNHHVVITSGGASRGAEDHLAAALDSLGKRHVWQLAIKPGRPMFFGQIGTTAVIGLPGNPVAVFVCFLVYVYPLLRRLGGAPWPEPRRLSLPAAFDFLGRKTGRREFWRGTLVEREGRLHVDKFARDGSGLISGLQAADGLIDVPEDVPAVKRGDLVEFIPFAEYGILRG